jgi:carboxyl-terminal processing protease
VFTIGTGAAITEGAGANETEVPSRFVEAFHQVWSTVNERLPQEEREHVSWEDIGNRYRERLGGVRTRQQLRELLSEMLDELDRSHLAIVPAQAAGEVTAGTGDPDRAAGTAGLEARVLQQQAIVVAVTPGGPAARAGVSPGWIISAIEGSPLAPILGRISQAYASSTLLDLRLVEAVRSRLTGPRGRAIAVTFVDGRGERRVETLTLDAPRGEPARFGRLPPTPVWVSFDRRDGVGHLAFNAFLDPGRLMPEFERAVRSCRSCAGMVLDLRGNRGGIAAMAMGLAGWFVEEPGHALGTMKTPDSTIRFAVFPRPEPFRGRLAVLVDGLTASTAEILAGGLQDLGRARIFGSRTAGAALPSVIHRLPTGDAFQFPIASYRAADGEILEGRGVTPDEQIHPTREQLLAGRDPALQAALEWVHSDGSPRVGRAEQESAP